MFTPYTPEVTGSNPVSLTNDNSLPVFDSGKVFGMQPVADDVAFVQTGEFISNIVDDLLAIIVGNTSLDDHGHDAFGPERFPLQHTTAHGFANEFTVGQSGLLR